MVESDHGRVTATTSMREREEGGASKAGGGRGGSEYRGVHLRRGAFEVFWVPV